MSDRTNEICVENGTRILGIGGPLATGAVSKVDLVGGMLRIRVSVRKGADCQGYAEILLTRAEGDRLTDRINEALLG